ncbi:PH domain-containing protein [Wenzhouxiangella sp. XN201]|uniref:PH domain-containing protein n=1 Tax=Wenzhouxiangella sp. XN201 TaxID=2710755 RepID=UPI0013C7F6DE|nr:PH domain-containing protein [Wenzhouxiangella sp. XN201]
MTSIDLNRWQRLAPMALLFLIINGGANFIRENLYVFAGAGVGFAFLDRLGLREFVLGGLVALLAAVLIAAVYHRRFRFRIEGDAIRVRRGLIENKDLRIRFARVQNVGLSQPVYFRPFGLVRFTLETPGAETTEVALPGISRELAQALRDHIARASGGVDVAVQEAGESADAESAPGNGSLLHEPGGLRLFTHGLVSNQVWLIAGVAAWLSGSMWDRIEQWIDSIGVSLIVQRVLELGWAGAFGLLLGLVILVFVLSGVISLIRFHGFSLRDHGDRFRAVGGALNRREQTLRREKLTGLTLYQTALGRLLGQWYLVGKQASSKEIEVDPSAPQFLIPGLRRGDLGLVQRLLPGFDLPEHFRPISRRFRTFFWTRLSAGALVLTGLVAWQQPQQKLWVAAGLGVLLLVLWLVHRSWRCWGWHLDNGVCWVQQGLFGLRRDAFELTLVQQAIVVRTPYFRRHGLASVRLILPHGQVTIPFIALDDAVALANRAIFAAETAAAHRV